MARETAEQLATRLDVSVFAAERHLDDVPRIIVERDQIHQWLTVRRKFGGKHRGERRA